MKIWKQKKAGKSARKRKTTHGLDRMIVKMCFSTGSSSCRKLSSGLAAQTFVVHGKTINSRLSEVDLKAYRPRKKPSLTEKMKASRHAWAVEHSDWTSTDWEQVKKVGLALISTLYLQTKLFARLFSRMNQT